MNLFAVFGLVIGFSLAYLLKMGFFVGLIFSLIVSGLVKAFFNSPRMQKDSDHSSSDNNFFLVTTFEVLGNLSKSKGIITPLDIQSTNQFMKALGIPSASQKLAQEAFRRGKESSYPLPQKVELLRKTYLFQPYFLNLFLAIQIRHVLIDGVISDGERKKLETIVATLKITSQQFTELLFQYGMRPNQDNTNDFYRKRNYTNEPAVTTTSAINDAYILLQVKPKDSALTIKRAYRRLMSQYHPDKIMARGASSREIEAANKKTQQIQVAYQLIKKVRNDL